MKKIFILALALSVLTSCKKNEQFTNPLTTAPIVKIDSNITVSQLVKVPPANVKIGTKKYKLLGWGYDVTGRYADSSAVRGEVINMSSFASDYAGRLNNGYNRSGIIQMIDAGNAQEISATLSNQLLATKGTKLFGGEIAEYFTADPFSAKYIYGSFSPTLWDSFWEINAPASMLQGYLTNQFKNDLVALDAEALVKKYGTHILTNIVLGAKFNIIYRAKTSHADRYASEAQGMRYAVSNIFSLWSGQLDKRDPSLLGSVTDPQLVFSITGGVASKVKVTTINNKITKVDIKDWLSSTSEENDGFIDIRQNGLLSLSELIDDPAKKAAVSGYIQAYLSNKQVKPN